MVEGESLLVLTVPLSLITSFITNFRCFNSWNRQNTTLCNIGSLNCSRSTVTFRNGANKSIRCFKKVSEIEAIFQSASFCFSRSITSISISKILSRQWYSKFHLVAFSYFDVFDNFDWRFDLLKYATKLLQASMRAYRAVMLGSSRYR